MSFQLIVSSRTLLAAAKLALPLVPSGSVVPILENLLLTVADGNLTLRASNLNTVFTTAPIAVECTGSGSICVPAKLFTQTLAGLPDQPLTMVFDEETYAVELRAARSKYRLAGEATADFPRPIYSAGKKYDCQLMASSWAEGLAAVLPFASNDNTKPVLTGVAIQAEASGLRLVTTDGFRVSMFHHAVQGEQGEIGLASSAVGNGYVLPAEAATLLIGLLRDKAQAQTLVYAAFAPDYFRMELPAGQLHCRLIDDRYPEWQNVVPVSQDYELYCDRDELLAAIGRAALYANEKTRQVRFSLGMGGRTDEFALAAEDLDFSNEGSETVSGHYEGEAMQIGFNAAFLTQSLKVLPSGEIALSLSTPNRAMMMRPASEPDTLRARLRGLLMPLQLNTYATVNA